MNRPMMHVVDPQTGESDPAEIRRVFDSQSATALAWRESTIAERIARLALIDGLLGEDVEIIHAGDANEAIAIAADDPPDAVVAEPRLMGGSGNALLGRFKQELKLARRSRRHV